MQFNMVTQIINQCKLVARELENNSDVQVVEMFLTRAGNAFLVEMKNKNIYEMMPVHLVNDNDKGFYKITKCSVNNELTNKHGFITYDHEKCGYYHIDEENYFELKW